MCTYREWEKITRRVQEAVDEGLREFLADAAARVEAFVDDLKSRRARRRTRAEFAGVAGDPERSGSPLAAACESRRQRAVDERKAVGRWRG